MSERGKYAESKVQQYLEARKQARACFTYNRILDARSARGMMSNPQPGDFQWFEDTNLLIAEFDQCPAEGDQRYTRNGLIEVKEVEHEFRLPFQNFGADQVGRMRIREMAGSECIVLVCHRESGARGGIWRQVPLEFFRERPGPKFGSWDLSSFAWADSPDTFLEAYFS